MSTTTKIDDGGPAFPVLDVDEHRQPYSTLPGMALRDYFAAKAMQALIEKTELLIQAVLEDGTHHGSPDELIKKHTDGICSSAYRYADAMIQARKGANQ